MISSRSTSPGMTAMRQTQQTPTLESGPLLAVAEFPEVDGSPSSRVRTGANSTSHNFLRRRSTALPLCMSRSQQEAAVSAYASPHALNSQGRRGTVMGASMAGVAVVLPDELPENVERAMQMLTTYPLMKVSATAFENSLRTTHHHTSMRLGRTSCGNSPALPHVLETVDSGAREGDATPNSANTSANTSVMLESSAVMQSVLEDSLLLTGECSRDTLPGSDRHQAAVVAAVRARPDNMVRLAAAMKRASMWQAIVVSTIAQEAMTERFRELRLRHALEKHLLPTLVKRREETGSVVNPEAAKRLAARRQRSSVARGTAAGGGGGGGSVSALPSKETGGETPTSAYLREHLPLFAVLGNSALLDALAETMTRYRFVSGEVIAWAGEPSQSSLYFLVSGKCECRVKAQDHQGSPGPDSPFALPWSGAADDGSNRGGFRGAQMSAGSPRSGVDGRRSANVHVLYSGESFGGIFNSSAVFHGTYKAISQCILWVMRADDFERVFRAFADRTMMEHYVSALRSHTEEIFPTRFPVRSVLSRVPVYRTLNQPTEKYLADFTPIVKVRGEKLFDQGDAPGDVYCLVEGSVRRSVRGADGTYASGVSQDLSLNSFSTLRVAGRCVLLGEEPHILPCTQRYRCTIRSRTAMLFRIPGERFVSALLDDPTQFVALRERLSKLFLAQMTLHPSCLGFAPLLRQFPPSSLAALAQSAEPRVYGRSHAMSEPAQGLREIFLVVSGDVRDPRSYGHLPTRPLPTPPPSDDDEEADEDGAAAAVAGDARGHAQRKAPLGGRERETEAKSSNGGRKAAQGKGRGNGGNGGGGGGAAAAPKGGGKVKSPKIPDAAFGNTPEEEEEKDWMTSSFLSAKGCDLTGGIRSLDGTVTFNSTAGSGGGGRPFASIGSQQQYAPRRGVKPSQQQQQQQQPLVAAGAKAGDKVPQATPDEQQEFNPPMPTLAAKRFLYTLGGGWEGLLLDKWPNGWGTTSVVEAWAIPTAKLRAEFNSCPKATQASILLAAREQQKLELGLAHLSTTKLPSMSVYQQQVAPAAAAAAPVPATAAGHGAKRTSPSNVPRSSGRSTGKESSTGLASTEKRPKRSASSSGSARGSGSAAELLDLSGTGGTLQPGNPPLRKYGSLCDGGEGEARASQQLVITAPAFLKGHRTTERSPAVGAAAAAAAPPLPPHHRKVPSSSTAKKKHVSIAPTGVSTARTGTDSAKAAPGQSHAPPPSGALLRRRTRPSTQSQDTRVTRVGHATSTSPTDTSAAPSENLLALYNGEFRDDEMLLYSNIVRKPVLPPSVAKRALARGDGPAATAVGLSSEAWPGSGGDRAVPPSDYPATAASASGWFHEVPVREPLPGMTALSPSVAAPAARASAMAVALPPPAMCINTKLLTRPGPGHPETLQAHADYFSATNAARTAAMAGESPSARTPSKGRDRARGIPTTTPSTTGASRPELPKRHALAM